MTEAIWAELLNSDWHDHLGTGRREDRLDDPKWLVRYLERHGMDRGDVPTAELIGSLRGLRTLLRRIVDLRVSRRPVPGSDWEALDLILARAPIVRRIETGSKGRPSGTKGSGSAPPAPSSGFPAPGSSPPSPRLILVPAAGRLESFLAEIVQSFVESLSGDGERRIKVCRNPDCLWVFYDRSKNRSRRWCEDTCGNLMKVRRFRKKEKRLRGIPR